jgi:hypothetical protein
MENRKVKQVLSWGWHQWWRGEGIRKWCRKVNVVEILCTQRMKNGKMRPVETIPGMGGGEFNYDTL